MLYLLLTVCNVRDSAFRMSVGLLRFVLSQALSRSAVPRISLKNTQVCRCHVSSPWLCRSFSTDTESGDTDVTHLKKGSKKSDPRARVTFGSVGRKVAQRHIQLIGNDGEELGVMHRADVIRLLDQTGLKLVAINEKCDPPLYKLMKGKEIYEEQLKLRETNKAKKELVQSKELSFSSDISHHDLDIKLRQSVGWLEKKNHVKLTIRARTASDTPPDKVLTQMVEKISVPVVFVSNPTVVRGGRAAMCILRLASAKEQQKKAAETLRESAKPDFVEEVQKEVDVSEEPKDFKQQ